VRSQPFTFELQQRLQHKLADFRLDVAKTEVLPCGVAGELPGFPSATLSDSDKAENNFVHST
jgi:hypothetical protein